MFQCITCDEVKAEGREHSKDQTWEWQHETCGHTADGSYSMKGAERGPVTCGEVAGAIPDEEEGWVE